MYFQMASNSLLESMNSEEHSRDIEITNNTYFNQQIVSQIHSQTLKLIQEEEKAEKQRFNDMLLGVKWGLQKKKSDKYFKESQSEITLKEISVEITNCSENTIQGQGLEIMDCMKKMFNYHQIQKERMKKISQLCQQLERQNQSSYRNNLNKSNSQQQQLKQIPKAFTQSFDLQITDISPNQDSEVLKKIKALELELNSKNQIIAEMDEIISLYKQLSQQNQHQKQLFELKSEKITEQLFHLMEEVQRTMNDKAETEIHIEQIQNKWKQEKKTTHRLQKELVLSRQIVRSLTFELQQMEKQIQQQNYFQPNSFQIEQNIKNQYDKVLIEFVEEQNKKYYEKLKEIQQYYEKQFLEQKNIYQSKINSINEHLDNKTAELNIIKTQLADEAQLTNSILQSKGKQIIQLQKQLLTFQRQQKNSFMRDPEITKLIEENAEVKNHLNLIMQEWQRTQNKCKSLEAANFSLQKKLSRRVSRELSEEGSSNLSQSSLIKKLQQFEKVQSTDQLKKSAMGKLNRQKSAEGLHLMKKDKNSIYMSALEPQKFLTRSKTQSILDSKNLHQSQIQPDEEYYSNVGLPSIKVSLVCENSRLFQYHPENSHQFEQFKKNQQFHKGINQLNFIKRQISQQQIYHQNDYQ